MYQLFLNLNQVPLIIFPNQQYVHQLLPITIVYLFFQILKFFINYLPFLHNVTTLFNLILFNYLNWLSMLIIVNSTYYFIQAYHFILNFSSLNFIEYSQSINIKINYSFLTQKSNLFNRNQFISIYHIIFFIPLIDYSIL